MKPIVARNQAPLGLARAVRLAVSGMSYRLLRSGITTAILALAVAFLVHVLTHAILAERTQRAAWDSLGPTREASRWLTRLTEPDAPADVHAHLVGQDRWSRQRSVEYAAWTLDGDPMRARVTDAAEALRDVGAWAGRLSPAEAAVVRGGLELRPWLDLLNRQNKQRRTLRVTLEDLRLDPPLGSFEAFERFVTAQWPDLKSATRDIRAGHRAAIERFASADPRPLLERFAEPNRNLEQQVGDAPFAMPGDSLWALEQFADYRLTMEWIQARLQEPAVKQAVQAQWGTGELSEVLRQLADRDGATWWEQHLGKPDTGQTVFTAATRFVETESYLAVTDGYRPVDHGTPYNLPPGTLWLVGLSLLVCVVGVTNALLMSVTERFSEIATMKCLGALDRSVMQMFVAEAVIQGVLGGAVGVLLGLLLTALRGFAEFGTLFTRGFEGWASVLGAAAMSLAVGVLLAALAAVGPSWVASRLAPMEAMRVE